MSSDLIRNVCAVQCELEKMSSTKPKLQNTYFIGGECHGILIFACRTTLLLRFSMNVPKCARNSNLAKCTRNANACCTSILVHNVHTSSQKCHTADCYYQASMTPSGLAQLQRCHGHNLVNCRSTYSRQPACALRIWLNGALPRGVRRPPQSAMFTFNRFASDG